MTTPYVRKGKLPACVLDRNQIFELFQLVSGPDNETGSIEIAVEYKDTASAENQKIIVSSAEDFLVFFEKNLEIINFVIGFNYREGTDQILISYINTSPPSGSLYIFGEQTWVDAQFTSLANFFARHRNAFTTMIFNGFTGKIASTIFPFFMTGSLITLVLAIALPTRTRIEYFGILTVACIFGTFKLGLMFSDWMMKKLAHRYPYFLYQK